MRTQPWENPLNSQVTVGVMGRGLWLEGALRVQGESCPETHPSQAPLTPSTHPNSLLRLSWFPRALPWQKDL